MLGTPESKRLKVAALPMPKRLRAGRSKSLGSVSLSFDKPLPGKPPNIPDRLSPFPKTHIFHIATQSRNGERVREVEGR